MSKKRKQPNRKPPYSVATLEAIGNAVMSASDLYWFVKMKEEDSVKRNAVAKEDARALVASYRRFLDRAVKMHAEVWSCGAVITLARAKAGHLVPVTIQDTTRATAHEVAFSIVLSIAWRLVFAAGYVSGIKEAASSMTDDEVTDAICYILAGRQSTDLRIEADELLAAVELEAALVGVSCKYPAWARRAGRPAKSKDARQREIEEIGSWISTARENGATWDQIENMVEGPGRKYGKRKLQVIDREFRKGSRSQVRTK